MPAHKPASWTYAQEFASESPAVDQARQQAHDLDASAQAVSPALGATLRVLAASIEAAHVVEIGTGTGVSGLWLLEGMAHDGVLTTIDSDPEAQRGAREAYRAAGVPPQRTRAISGAALDVLPRLTSAAYDLVLLDADPAEYPAYVEHAARLLRRSGVLVLTHMLWRDRVADPAARDATTTTLRDLGKDLREDDRFVTTLLPVDDGLLLAVLR